MSDNISDNVGKKIVEALKKQSSVPVSPEDSFMEGSSDMADEFDTANITNLDEITSQYSMGTNTQNTSYSTSESRFIAPDKKYNSFNEIDNVFQSNINKNLGGFSQIQTDIELPNNVAILNRLIAKLPSGVSKQTGALIIRQTMEALGISMNSVIQEAREVQETLTNNARECQRTIIDYRKQICELEAKSQQYQKQAVTMNDVINLFSHV